jgi:hypothetical protein
VVSARVRDRICRDRRSCRRDQGLRPLDHGRTARSGHRSHQVISRRVALALVGNERPKYFQWKQWRDSKVHRLFLVFVAAGTIGLCCRASSQAAGEADGAATPRHSRSANLHVILRSHLLLLTAWLYFWCDHPNPRCPCCPGQPVWPYVSSSPQTPLMPARAAHRLRWNLDHFPLPLWLLAPHPRSLAPCQ